MYAPMKALAVLLALMIPGNHDHPVAVDVLVESNPITTTARLPVDLGPARALLANVVTSCPNTCEAGSEVCPGTAEHRVTEEDGASYGPDHPCQENINGFTCDYHECRNEEEHDAVDSLVLALGELSPTALRQLSSVEPALVVNVERASIQVFGCDAELVIANIPLTHGQMVLVTQQ